MADEGSHGRATTTTGRAGGPAQTRTGQRPRVLDFLVIGAAKSGTTTLFHYLKHHPGVTMPADKEAPFFAKASDVPTQWPAYFDERFGDAPAGRRLGKMTPRYLGDPHVAALVAATMPDVQLFAILRDPVERAFSKYRLMVRTGREHRTFARLVEDQLQPEALRRARDEPGPIRHSVVARGEYARQLERWLDHFPRQALQVQLTDDLERDPQAVVDSLLCHIGLEPGWRPQDLGQRYYVGGEAQRVPALLPTAQRIPGFRSAWRRLPAQRRQELYLWFNRQFNVDRNAARIVLDHTTRARLSDFYRPDVERLERLLGRPVPWPGLTSEGNP